MRHPMKKFALIELVSLGIVIILGTFALIKGFLFLIVLCIYLLSLSLLCDGLIYYQKNDVPHAGKQAIRAFLLFIFATYLLF
ncbi:hypothetical protein D8M04_14955 [Oceanobacillus piezotolerans]|uniref:DUF3953 domain-containing protein n=1 Tax=Oceanobacillus piezotolerans TaxID=2448030 RepID=A0A498DK91_9BACI|nr:hypothetical protein [Oceanobacillus piezotolerans]RLL42845.1 hypothetical protein D8M04_14955 [Oceanobacillus piezotolerans]